MHTIYSVWIFVLCLLSNCLVAVDTIYIVGQDNFNRPVYWSIFPPNAPSSYQLLDMQSYLFCSPGCIAFSQNQTAYIAGYATEGDTNVASYWTISPSGIPSTMNTLTGTTVIFSPSPSGVAFNSLGIGYIVGRDEFGNPAYWTVSTSGVVSSETELDAGGGYASAVGFTSSGTGYIGGLDLANNAVYWIISPSGVITGPFGLVGGEAGGAGYVYAVASSPSGTTYLVGSNTAGYACYWTISPSGIASSAVVLDGSFNSMARGVAFVPGGEGIIVGQGTGNVSCYWLLSSSGVAGPLNALPNGSGSSSSAYGVAFSSNNTAYIVGTNTTFQPVYWTIPLTNPVPEYHLLDIDGIGIATAIAIYFPVIPPPIKPNPPKKLTGRYKVNDFGWAYEYCTTLNWKPSNSEGIVSYNIYKNSHKIATVSGSKTHYRSHDQKKATKSKYAVTAVDKSGNESTPATVTIK